MRGNGPCRMKQMKQTFATFAPRLCEIFYTLNTRTLYLLVEKAHFPKIKKRIPNVKLNQGKSAYV